ARADDAQDFLVAHVEGELAESDDGAVEKQLARIAHADREIRLRDGHACLPEREAVVAPAVILLAPHGRLSRVRPCEIAPRSSAVATRARCADVALERTAIADISRVAPD